MDSYPEIFALTNAQTDEMEKIALWGAGAGIGRLVGAGAGSAVGAGVGYATGKTPEERKSRAIGGAVIGGVGGLIPGQFMTRKGLTQASNFGKRQLHGVTGYLPGKGWRGQKLTPKPNQSIGEARVKALEGIGWNVPKPHVKDTEKAVVNLKSGLAKEREKGKGILGSIPERLSKTGPGQAWEKSRLRDFMVRRKLTAERSQRKLVEEGLTSLPGAAKGYVAPRPGLTRREVLKANLLAPGVALGVGVPAAFSAPGMVEAARERDPRLAARTLAETAGYTLAGGLPIGAALAAGTGVSAAAGKLLGSRPRPAIGSGQDAAGRVVQQPPARIRR